MLYPRKGLFCCHPQGRNRRIPALPNRGNTLLSGEMQMEYHAQSGIATDWDVDGVFG